MQPQPQDRPRIKLGVFSMPAHPPQRRLADIYELTGGYGGLLMLAYDWEGDNRRQWQHSMELLARKVMPRLEELTRLSTAGSGLR
jgi:hypothetical protein